MMMMIMIYIYKCFVFVFLEKQGGQSLMRVDRLQCLVTLDNAGRKKKHCREKTIQIAVEKHQALKVHCLVYMVVAV